MEERTENSSWTVGGLLNWTARYLSEKGSESPRVEAEVLLAHALNCQRIDLYGVRHGEVASDELRKSFKAIIRQRLEGCPVAYLVGRKEFFLLPLEVSPAVLIPRFDTEEVVLEYLRLAKGMEAARVLDVGTGSGNIALAVAKQHPGAVVTAVDLSLDALAVARRNAERHGLAGRIRFLEGDLFDPIPAGEQFDFVLSNPPYIASEELPDLAVGVRDYEPHMALDGGPGGFVVFDRLIVLATDFLAPGGYLIVEIHSGQEETARQRIDKNGAYQLADTIHDKAGQPRVLRARFRG